MRGILTKRSCSVTSSCVISSDLYATYRGCQVLIYTAHPTEAVTFCRKHYTRNNGEITLFGDDTVIKEDEDPANYLL